MESLSAHDGLGLALLEFGQDARGALDEFNRAIELANEDLKPSDGEWAELYWHRGAAEQQVGRKSEAAQDFLIAENSFSEAMGAVQGGANAYKPLLVQLTKQHATLLESEGKHDEAAAVLKQADQ
jgi:tetratricopeptide (TPR) repeat protein